MFPFGRPVLALAVVAAVTGVALLLRPPRPTAALTVWTFTPDDAAADRAAAGPRVDVDLVAAAAIDVRLSSLFMADLTPAAAAAGRPDVVELDIGSAGKFLRGAPADVGFRPLGGHLRRGGWLDRLSPSALVPYSVAGVPFGVPLDLHPTVLVYRRDLIDPSSADTWPQLQALCLRSQRSPNWAVALPSASSDVLLVMLQQRHVTLVDAAGVPHLTDPRVAETVCWYARAAAGPNRIGTDVNPAPGGVAADLAAGRVAAVVAADWAVADIARAAPDLAGRLAVRPLPRFDPADARTAGWGGTMVGIPRFCPDPDRAWQLVERAYLSPAAAVARYRATGVLPPQPAVWADPAFHQPDPAFAGQRVTEVYMALAAELPPRVTTPYTTTAGLMLAWVLDRAVSHVRHGGGGGGLEPAVRGWLADRQAQLQRLVDFDRRTGR